MSEDREKAPKLITISVSDKFISIEIGIQDAVLMNYIFNGLKEYVQKSSPIKFIETDTTSLSKRKRLVTKIVSNRSQMKKFGIDFMRLIKVK